jgi:hypothetical protein
MANYDSNDMDFTWDGDFIRGEDGDIGDTSSDGVVALINEIRSLVKAETLDWEKEATFATNLSDFQGEANTQSTGEIIEERIFAAITNHGIVRDGDLTVRVVPVHVNQVLIMIRVVADSTSGNSLSPAEPIKVDLIYDTLEKGVFFLLDNQIQRSAL